jgi:serine/threonine protein kinase
VLRGQRIADRFEIKQQAGAGGMGAVYRALDSQTGRPVAVKLLTLNEEASAERFAREANLLSQLSHPGIVGYVAHGMHQEKHYLVMEWVKGETLNRLLLREGLTVEETLIIARAVSQALEELHRHGLVHRDIKPSNLILPENSLERVKLLDFGLARRANELDGPTRTGLMVGSPGYMSPEQARGWREVSPAADIFSLGAVLYECLTGRAAFEGLDPLSIRSKVLMLDPPPAHELNAEVPPALSTLIQKMLAKATVDRPQSGGDVAMSLSQVPDPLASSKRKPLRGRFEANTALISESSVTSALREREVPTLSEVAESPPQGALKTQFVFLVGSEGEHTPPPEAVRAAIVAEGGIVEVLDSGQMVAMLTGSRPPEEEAARAAKIALMVRASLPPLVPMTMVAEHSPEPDLELLIERGVRAIHLEYLELIVASVNHQLGDEARISLDLKSEQLLEARFLVRKQPKAAYLISSIKPLTERF